MICLNAAYILVNPLSVSVSPVGFAGHRSTFCVMSFGSEVPAQSRPSVLNEPAKPSVAWEPYQ